MQNGGLSVTALEETVDLWPTHKYKKRGRGRPFKISKGEIKEGGANSLRERYNKEEKIGNRKCLHR